MSVALACIALIGLLCGWLMLHWLVIGALSVGVVLVAAGLERWDWLLIPTLFGILALFQVSFLIGAAARSWREDSAGGRGDAARDAETILDGERVLVVEDDPLTAALMAGEIEAASGRPLGPAVSVADALRRIAEDGVEAAIVDIKLRDGAATPVALELIARGVPFVIVSAVAAPGEILRREPAVAVFRKPVTAAVPIRRLAGEIRRARAQRQRAAGRG